MPEVIFANEKGRRFSTVRGSGRRMLTQSTVIRENSMKAMKIPRQPEKSMITAPRAGAMAGTRVKIIMAKDTMRAISRPE